MDIEIVETTENVLLNRTEYKAKVHHVGESTPTRETLRAKLAATVNKDSDILVLVVAESEFGKGLSNVVFHCYDTKDNMIYIEKNYILKRNKLIEDKK